MKKIMMFGFLLILMICFISCSKSESFVENATDSVKLDPSLSATKVLTREPTKTPTPLPTNLPTKTATLEPFNIIVYPTRIIPPESFEKGDMDYALVILIEYNHITRAISEIETIGIELVSEEVLNHLCWIGSLNGYAKEVLFSCEYAVDVDPELGAYRDSRGVARAVAGDFQGAIDDFTFFISWFSSLSSEIVEEQGFSQEMIDLRKSWIKKLEQNSNPFSEEELDYLLSSETEYILRQTFFPYLEVIAYYLTSYGYYEDVKIAYDEEMETFIGWAAMSTNNEEEALIVGVEEMLNINESVCIWGSIHGNADKIDEWCSPIPEHLESILSNEDVGDDIQGARDYFEENKFIYSYGLGIWKVYLGDVKGAITDFEDHLDWLYKNELEENPWYIPTETIEKWLKNLNENIFPFTKDDFYLIEENTFFTF